MQGLCQQLFFAFKSYACSNSYRSEQASGKLGVKKTDTRTGIRQKGGPATREPKQGTRDNASKPFSLPQGVLTNHYYVMV
jgi:hypothetical protein